MKLGLVTEFDAAHSLPGYQGKCANLHGHTYQVEIVVEGDVGDDGFVMDFYQLKENHCRSIAGSRPRLLK